MTTLFQYSIILLVGILIGCCSWFFPNAILIAALCGTYVAFVTAYFGIDITGMTSGTAKLPAGEFVKMKTWQYIISAIIFGCLFIEMQIKKMIDPSIDFTAPLLIVAPPAIACLLAIPIGIGANKKATPISSDTSKP